MLGVAISYTVCSVDLGVEEQASAEWRLKRQTHTRTEVKCRGMNKDDIVKMPLRADSTIIYLGSAASDICFE